MPKQRRGRGSIAITQPKQAIRGDLLQAFTKKQLLRLGFWEFKDATLHPLTNALFGPFKLTNWDMNKPQLKTLVPVLRLASKLILSPASIRFCDALISNPRAKEIRASRIWYPNRTDAHLEEIRYGPMQNRPVARMRAHVRKTLERLAENVHWYAMTPKNKAWPTFEFSDAVTTRLDGTSPGSDIYINYRSIETLRILALPSPNLSVRVTNAILRLQLHLAITLCHETIHALNHLVCANPPYFVEPFFGEHRITEMGFAWEQDVFGGEINWWWHATDFAAKAFLPLAVMKWPSAWIWGDEFETPGVELARRWPKASSTMFFVPMWWVNSLFCDRFWDEAEGREEELGLLVPPKTHGVRIWSGAPHHVDERWRKSQSEESLAHDWKGRVFRWPELRGGLTPSPKGGGRGMMGDEDDVVTEDGELPKWVVRRLSRAAESEPESESDGSDGSDSRIVGRDAHNPRSTQAAREPAAYWGEDVQVGDRAWKFAMPGGGVNAILLERFGNADMKTEWEAVDANGEPLERELDDYVDALAQRRRKKSVEEMVQEQLSRKRSKYRR